MSIKILKSRAINTENPLSAKRLEQVQGLYKGDYTAYLMLSVL